MVCQICTTLLLPSQAYLRWLQVANEPEELVTLGLERALAALLEKLLIHSLGPAVLNSTLSVEHIVLKSLQKETVSEWWIEPGDEELGKETHRSDNGLSPLLIGRLSDWAMRLFPARAVIDRESIAER